MPLARRRRRRAIGGDVSNLEVPRTHKLSEQGELTGQARNRPGSGERIEESGPEIVHAAMVPD